MERDASNDPFNGYASCPDTQRAYQSTSKENQQRWMIESEKIIQNFIEKIPTFPHFRDAYAYLAKQRHAVADQLKQYSEPNHTNHYGEFRNEDDHFRQQVSVGDGEQFWKWQKKKIFELMYQLISPLRRLNENLSSTFYTIENDYMICLKEMVTVDDQNADYYDCTVKFPNDPLFPSTIKHAPTLTQIELYDIDRNSNLNMIRIEYTPINHEYTDGHYEIAEFYHQALLNWQPNDGIDAFLNAAAKLSYLMAHLLLVKQGNSGIMEWLIRGIAYRNGLRIGKFNQSEGISWDFKAILTPNWDIYIQWYMNDLYVDCVLIPETYQKRLFSYKNG